MIDKFNFFDIYGYLLPGFVLLSLLWLPFGIVSGRWPGGELVSALLAIPVAYVAGHILQTFSSKVFRSTASDGRYPSDVLLDETDKTFSSGFKERLASRIEEIFGLEVNTNDPEENSRQRRDALFQCRSALIKAKNAPYAEQFEGIYSLMRNLTVAFLLGAGHIAGWCLGSLAKLHAYVQPWVVPCMSGALFVAIAFEFLQPAPPAEATRRLTTASMVSFIFAVLCSGYLLAEDQTVGEKTQLLLFTVVLITLFLARKCFESYRSFTWEFAKAIYRDFSTWEKPQANRPWAP